MAISSERCRLLFRKLDRDLERLSSEPSPQTIHRFRTGVRRLHVLLGEVVPRQDRNRKKMLKTLNRLRKRAGKVRDIDMQLAALRTLKSSQEPRRKTQLMQTLLELRARYERKLRKSITKKDLAGISKGLKRLPGQLRGQRKGDPLVVAGKILRKVIPPVGEVSDEQLHVFRTEIKRARYAVEFCADSRSSRETLAQLQHLQDSLGQWHDWATLTANASQRLGDIHQSSLVASLHSVTRSKFRQAVRALAASPLLRNQKTTAAANEPRKSATPALARTAAA